MTAQPSARRMKNLRSGITFAVLLVISIVWILPLLTAIVTSLRTQADITTHGFWSLPSQITFSNFVTAWTRAKVSRFLLNSFLITLPSVLFILLFSSLNAYALAKYKFKGNFFFYMMFVAGSMLPTQIIMLPVFKMSNDLGLYNSHANLIIIQVAWHIAFASFVLRNFMKTLPSEIFESARIDGCSEFGIYWQMVLPLVLPGLAAVATLEFTWVFNDYLWSIILARSDAIRPITAGLAQLRGMYQTDWPLIVAGALIAALPTALVFLGLQKYFIGGLTLGSSK